MMRNDTAKLPVGVTGACQCGIRKRHVRESVTEREKWRDVTDFVATVANGDALCSNVNGVLNARMVSRKG